MRAPFFSVQTRLRIGNFLPQRTDCCSIIWFRQKENNLSTKTSRLWETDEIDPMGR